ncbi:MAG: sugar phosphate nucleotidyltransferase [Terriglobales bacterium]
MGQAGMADAAVLCGGLGTRLRPALPDQPKSLAEVGGQPFLDRLLHQLTAAGCRRIVLCTGYRADAIEHRYAAWKGGAELVFSPESAPLGTAGALALARRHLRTDPVLIANGDSIVLELDVAALVQAAEAAAGALAVVAGDGRTDTGAITLDASGRILSFTEKPGHARAPAPINAEPRFQSAGVYALRRRLLEAIPADAPSSLERDWFPRWLEQGLRAYVHPGPLIDIGTPERWRQAQEQLR